MISRLKQTVKKRLEEWKIAEYYAWLDELYVSYQEWIIQREMAYREAKTDCRDNLLVCVLGKNMQPQDLSDATKADVLVFSADVAWLDEYAKEVVGAYFVENPECVLAYGDEDEWNADRTIRMNPWFKPDFSPETLLQYFYFGNVIALRSSAFDEIDDSMFSCMNLDEGDTRGENSRCARMIREWYNLSDEESRIKWLYQLSMNLSFPVQGERIGHIPYVLYHSPNLQRHCMGSEYDECRAPLLKKLQDKVGEYKKVSIVIPSKDHPETLETCLESLVKTITDCEYEIIVVDNGSNEENRAKYDKMRVKYGFNYFFCPMDFHFSKMCNMGAGQAKGELLLFLNDDIEAIEAGWMSIMKQYAVRAHVGAIGAKLYYPDSKMIQHAGITNLRLGPVHKFQFLEDVRPYYDGRNQMDHNAFAVTGACLMVRKDVWEACGGFSEDLAVAFNDVELCFRIYKEGYYNVVCNSISLYHHESLSRGSDEAEEKQVRLQTERNKLYAMHPDVYGRDPFYHPYLNNLILDTRYSCAYEYPAGADVAVEVPVLLKDTIKEEWYNECLQISLEYAGDLQAWIEVPDASGDYLYFQGYQFVIGSENPTFDRYLLCQSIETGEAYSVPCVYTFRPDLDRNVNEGHASLCGFSLVIEKKDLKKGRYRVGCMAKSNISRQVLCRFTNKYIEV